MNFYKNRAFKRLSYCFLIFIISFLLIPESSSGQILSQSILDLRTKIKNHKWSFHPGDSPESRGDSTRKELLIIDDEDEESESKDKYATSNFVWAAPKLKARYKRGWINDIQIQLAWTRYRDKNGNRPFKDFKKYFEKYNGYGWYRTEFTITKSDVFTKFKSTNLVLRLGKIGQANAVYLNGNYIGGTGLKETTPRNINIADTLLHYDKIRYYKLPREYLKYNTPNVIAVRVFAKYPISPGLSHGKYYITSERKIDRAKFWDNFKKIFVIVLTILLGLFYLYWYSLFRDEGKAGIYFSIASFAMALNTFMQSQIVYSIWKNALWIKKIEFASFIIFVHLILLFFISFTKADSKPIRLVNRFWDIIGVLAVIAVLLLPNMILARRFIFAWGVAPGLLLIYLVYIIIKGRKIPSIGPAALGFGVMVLLLISDVLVGFQFRWVLWEFSLKDYGFAFFGIMIAGSIVSNMKKSRELITKQKAEKERLSKFFSPDVIDEILDGELSLGGQEKNITTLFADIVGFTGYSETQPPGKVLNRLNDMFTRISEVIIKYKATLDKYIGDCVMAFWGAPKPTPNDAYNAISCALAMQKVCNELNENLPEDATPFQLRIGINYGPAIAGYIGSNERMDYSVIGDAVNTASRIESNGIPGRVAISESTFIAAGGDDFIKYSETRDIVAKGKEEPIKIYLVDEILERPDDV